MPVSSLKTPYWTVRYSASAFPALGPGRRLASFRAATLRQAPGPLALSPVRSKYRAQGQRAQDMLSARAPISRLRSFASLQARGFARHPGRPYRNSVSVGSFNLLVSPRFRASALSCTLYLSVQDRCGQYRASVSRTLDSRTGQPWLFHPSIPQFVTSLCPRYASRPNRAIDDRGLSPHKIRSLVGCSHNGQHQPPPGLSIATLLINAPNISNRAAIQDAR